MHLAFYLDEEVERALEVLVEVVGGYELSDVIGACLNLALRVWAADRELAFRDAVLEVVTHAFPVVHVAAAVEYKHLLAFGIAVVEAVETNQAIS